MSDDLRRGDPVRTIVISDAHAYPQMIGEALEQCGFEAGVDRLIFAGDFLDRGSDPEPCLRILGKAGAEMLWGNHEAAVLLCQPIFPQDCASLGFRERLLEGCASGAWQLVACAGGVLVSHAGISADYAADFERAGRSPEALAKALNDEFRAAVERMLAGEWPLTEDSRLLGERGPLWLRPSYEGPEGMLCGAVQVVGHTTPSGSIVDELRDAGVHLVDPGAAQACGVSGLPPCRYAVLRDGAVEVVTAGYLLAGAAR